MTKCESDLFIDKHSSLSLIGVAITYHCHYSRMSEIYSHLSLITLGVLGTNQAHLYLC